MTDAQIAEEGNVSVNKFVIFLYNCTRPSKLFDIIAGFLELINNMLATGMVPALYTDEERENIVGGIREEAKKVANVITKYAQYSCL